MTDPVTRSVGLVFFSLGILFLGLMARLPEIKVTLGLSKLQIGMVLFAGSIGALIGTVSSGWYMKNLSVGRACLIGVGLVVVGVNLPPLATGLVALLILFGISGLTDSLLNIAMNSAAATVERERGVNILSTCHGMFSLGAAAGAAISGLMAKWEVPLSTHFIGLGIVIAGLNLMSRRTLFTLSQRGAEESSFRLPGKAIAWLAVIVFCSGIGEGTMIDWSPVYFRENLGAGPFWTSFSAGAVTSMMALVRFGGDELRTRFGERTVLLSGAGLTFVGVWMGVIIATIPGALAGNFIAGLGLATMFPIAFSAAARVPGVSAQAAISGLAATSLLGFLIGPVIIGLIAENFGLRVGFGFVGVLSLLMLVACLRAPVTKKGKLQPQLPVNT